MTAASRRGAGALGGPVPLSCASWFNVDLSAYACSQSRLKEAIARHELSRQGQFALRIPGHHGGSSPGVAQVLGGPVKPRTTISLVGKAAADETIAVNCAYRGKLYVLRLNHIAAETGATIAIRLVGGKPRMILARLRGVQSRTNG
jgi:hypothetical protein